MITLRYTISTQKIQLGFRSFLKNRYSTLYHEDNIKKLSYYLTVNYRCLLFMKGIN